MGDGQWGRGRKGGKGGEGRWVTALADVGV